MTESCPNALGQALRGFLLDDLRRVRGLSRHTLRSCRDVFKLLLIFLEGHLQRPAATLDFPDLSREHLLAFLQHLQSERGNSAATRNVRLAALHSFARYAAPLFPQHCGVCQTILAIPFKRADQRIVEYLEHNEMQALLQAPDRSTRSGQCDHALLLTMYNTGARVQEILDLRPCDLQLDRPHQALLRGKRGRCRYCPLCVPTALGTGDLDTDLFSVLLTHLETGRGNSVRSCNTRLAAVRSFFGCVAVQESHHAALAHRLLAMPAKRNTRRPGTASMTRSSPS